MPEAVFQFVVALSVGAILGGVGHLWLKTERLDREQAKHEERFDSVARTLVDLKKTLESVSEGMNFVGTSVARIEGQLLNGFAKGAKAPTGRK